jgi:hypothetical protein
VPTVDVGVFRLVDPPAGVEAIFRDTVPRIGLPWHLVAAAAQQAGGAFSVFFDDWQGSAEYRKYGRTFHFSTRYAGWEAAIPFVFTHEVGHLVDDVILTGPARRALMALMHVSPVTLGHMDHDHVDVAHPEHWRTNEPISYMARLHEAFADVFVRAYAPTLWPGYPRFIHHTEDAAAVRRIIEELPPMTVTRLAGSTRWETPVLVSLRRFPNQTPVTVYIATGETFPDALVAGTMTKDGPLLLVPSTAPVPEVVLSELRRLDVAEVVILGGTSAVSAANEATIRQAAGA